MSNTFKPRTDGASVLQRLMKQRAAQQQDILTRHAVNKMDKPNNTRGLRPLKIQPNRTPGTVKGDPFIPHRTSAPTRKPQSYIKSPEEGGKVGRGNWDDTGTD